MGNSWSWEQRFGKPSPASERLGNLTARDVFLSLKVQNSPDLGYNTGTAKPELIEMHLKKLTNKSNLRLKFVRI